MLLDLWPALTPVSTAGVESHTGGEYRETDSRFSRQYGRIDWHVDIRGRITVHQSGTLDITVGLVPVAGEGRLDYLLAATGTAHSAGHLSLDHTLRLDGGHIHTRGRINLTMTPALELRHITDPPELWDLLDLFELTP